MAITLMSRYVVKLDRRIKTIEVITIKKKGADSSRVWVVSGTVLVQKTDTCIPVLPQTS